MSMPDGVLLVVFRLQVFMSSAPVLWKIVEQGGMQERIKKEEGDWRGGGYDGATRIDI